jgi:predicted ABC-type ATPase
VADQPFVLMIAGPNGSGKTTLTEQLRRDGSDLGRYINPDEIAATLAGDYDIRVGRAQALAARLSNRPLLHRHRVAGPERRPRSPACRTGRP